MSTESSSAGSYSTSTPMSEWALSTDLSERPGAGCSLRSLRALVIGLGSAGQRHAENLLALGVGAVEALSEQRKLSDVVIRGVPVRVFHDLKAALAAHPQVVIVANPSHLHARYAAAALEQGSHVYVEKPLADSAHAAAPLTRLARERGLILAVGCQLRFNPCLERLKMLLDVGRFGRLIHVQINAGEYLPGYHPDEDYRLSYAARAELGGGILLTQIHDLNYLHWLFGRFDSLYAIGGKTSELEINAEDNVSVLLQSAAGVAISAHMDFLQRPRRRTLAVIGEEGSAVWDAESHSLQWVSCDGKREELGPSRPFERNRMFLDAMADFLRCVQSSGLPRTNVAEGIADLCLVDTIRRSFAHQRAERVAYDDVGA